MIRRAILFYLGLTALGIVLATSFNFQPILFFPLQEKALPIVWQFPFAIGITLMIFLSGRLVLDRTDAGKIFDTLLEDTFVGISVSDAVTLALISALAEEWLFRSVGVPFIGVIGSSFFFAALHIPPNRKLLFWPAMAFVLGYAFAEWTERTNSALGATLAHFFINAITLVRIARKKKSAPTS